MISLELANQKIYQSLLLYNKLDVKKEESDNFKYVK